MQRSVIREIIYKLEVIFTQMVLYRRNKIPGGTFFFTVVLQNRQSDVLTKYHDYLRQAFNNTKSALPFKTIATVVLPDHMHVIWELPENDANYSKRWQKIKSDFTKSLKRKGVKIYKNKKGEYNLWQRRYWEHTIRDDTDLQRHVDYIHYNPVKHGLVNKVVDWPFSTFHAYIKRDLLTADWAAEPEIGEVQFGE